MSMEIRYFTKSKKGNTYKLATFIATKLNLKALDVLNDLTNKTDILILVNAMYAADVDKNIKDFLIRNKENIGIVVNINSSATGRSTYNSVKKVCDKYNISLCEEEYHTRASWLLLNKDRPNETDFKRLEDFILKFNK